MKSIYKNLNIIGADETGVGDYFTPLVAAAVFVPYQNIFQLEKMGVRDSKKISDQKILHLASQIKPLVRHSTKHLSQPGYNKLNTSFNANELKMFLHISNINFLESKIQDHDLIIVDKFSTLNSIEKYYERLLRESFNFQPFKKTIKYIEKGEKEHIAVAAASIIARAKLLELMQKQNSLWKTSFPLGCNKQVEIFAVDFKIKHGKQALLQVVKIKFKTTQKIL